MEEEDVFELANSLPYDVFYIPEKKQVPEAFVVGSSNNVFKPTSDHWFVFFTNEGVRKGYEEAALSIINETLSTLNYE